MYLYSTGLFFSYCGNHLILLLKYLNYPVPQMTLTWYLLNENKHFCSYTLRHGKNGHSVANNIFKCIFFKDKFCVLIEISLKLTPNKSPIAIKAALVLAMAWCQTGDKPLPELMLGKFYDTTWLNDLTHCGTGAPYHATWSSLVQVMPCCLTAPSHYLNHYLNGCQSSLRSCGIHLRASSQEIMMISIFIWFWKWLI